MSLNNSKFVQCRSVAVPLGASERSFKICDFTHRIN